MRIMKFNKTYIYILLTAFLFTNCEKLDELNENPNQPEEVSSDVLFTSAVRSSVNSMVMESFLLGNNIAQITAKTLRTEVDVYSWNAFPTVWEELYGAATNIVEVEQIAGEAGNDAMQGAAKVMKVWIFSTLTLAYGDIPYSEAIQGVNNDNWFPVYDDQQTIFNGEGGLLDELEAADQLFETGTGTIGGDIIFEGDAAKWQKFANSLRLRLLMHLSLQQDVSAEFADIVANRPIMTSNDESAILVYTGTFPNEFPTVPLKQGDFDAVVMSKSSVLEMETFQDPRLGKYARPFNSNEIFEDPSVVPIYKGADNGLETGGCDKSGSRLGYMYYDYPAHLTVNDKADGLIMTYAEVELLLAEAAAKGWIPADVETHYRNGIEASMNYYDVDYEAFGWTDFDDFYNGSGVAWDGDDLDIWKQKWLAIFFHGLEPYFEFRRWMYEVDDDWAALPFVTPPCQNTNDDMLPVRFLYPGNEQSLNPDNYSAAVDKLGENSQNARMWLMMK